MKYCTITNNTQASKPHSYAVFLQKKEAFQKAS